MSAIAAFNGCRRAQTPAKPATARIYAAASTAGVLREIAARYKADGGGEVVITAEGSNVLAKQILSDAPADLFLSANEKWADEVRSGGRDARRATLLTNTLVLVVPKGNPANVHDPRDLTDRRVAHIALAGENVPAGIYAAQALSALGVYDQLKGSAGAGRIVRGQDVTRTLIYVARGEAEAGIVYSTDALASDSVEVVYTFDPKTYDKINYVLMLLKGDQTAGPLGEANPEAVKLYDYLASDKAAEIFRKYGFTPMASKQSENKAQR